LEPYNWHNVNLGELVEDSLVSQDRANKILERAKENLDETGNGAVGGLNPYEPADTQEQSDPSESASRPTAPSSSDTTALISTQENSGATGPQSSETVTLTQDPTNTDSEANTANTKTSTPTLSEKVTITSGSGSTGLDIDVPTSSSNSGRDQGPRKENPDSGVNKNDNSGSKDNSESSGTGDGGSINPENGSGTITFF
jgi:hypothetical protein